MEQLNSESHDVQFLDQKSTDDSTRDEGTKVTSTKMDEEDASDDVNEVSFLVRLH